MKQGNQISHPSHLLRLPRLPDPSTLLSKCLIHCIPLQIAAAYFLVMLCCSASTLTMPLSLDESWRVAWWMQAPGEEMLASYSILPQGATGSAGSQATVGLTVWRIVRTHRWHPRLALLPASAIKGVAAGPSQWNSADIGCSCSRCTKIYIYISELPYHPISTTYNYHLALSHSPPVFSGSIPCQRPSWPNKDVRWFSYFWCPSPLARHQSSDSDVC